MIRCGVDSIDIERVEQSMKRFGERFYTRFLTENERAYCEDNAERTAARIAAKEAVGKLLGTGIGDIRWRDVEILREDNGRPTLRLHGNAATIAAELGLTAWDISLTHTDTTATAMCVALALPKQDNDHA